ncbi:MAG: GNAT family N-acetyltransferase [Candidatus Hodarchaeota archaeon]
MLSEENTSERESVKLRRLFFRKKKKSEEKKEKEIQKEQYKFIVMKMSWDQALNVLKQIEEHEAEEGDILTKNITIRELQPSKDAEKFIRCYNRAFITAPDPYRSLTVGDLQHFKPESTFVAELHGRIVGFIFLVIEPLIKEGRQIGNQGVIAGIGVDPRYRRKRIAFMLAARAAKYFEKNNVMELVCEVYHENEISYNFIRSFGFTQTGTIYL